MKLCPGFVAPFSFAIAAILIVVGPVVASGTEHSGDVWGTWTRADSPHIITGEVRVPPGQSLIIEPGCQVLFRGWYKFVVDSAAILHAVGTETDSILFDEETPGTYWHGIRFLKADSRSEISYCRLQHGKASRGAVDSLPGDNDGGAVYCLWSTPLLRHNTFTANISERAGSAVYLNCSPCTISSSLFLGNWVVAGEGGAVRCDTSDAVIVGNSFVSDSAVGRGGAISCWASDATISESSFEGNWAGWYGGAIYGICGTRAMLISNNTFVGNKASCGGALFWESIPYGSRGDPTIRDNVFVANYGGEGGAVELNDCWGILERNLFLSNTAAQGGALSIGNGGKPVLSHCVFVSNVAFSCGYGGAIYGNSGGPVQIDHCTFAFNRAENHGGAIATFSVPFTISNSIFWGDSAPDGPELWGWSQSYRVTYSDVAGAWSGEGNINEDPLFVSPPDTVQLRWGSLCIDAGDPTSPLDPDNTRADMGAYYFDQTFRPRTRNWTPRAASPIPLRGEAIRSHPQPPEH